MSPLKESYPSLSTLPIELLLNISEYLFKEKDFSALARTAKHLYTLLNPILYRNHVKAHKQRPATLGWAAIHGQTRTMQLLIESGADISTKSTAGRSLFVLAASFGHLHFLEYLSPLKGVNPLEKDLMDNTALTHACAAGHTDVVRFLLTIEGMDPGNISTGSGTYPSTTTEVRTQDTPFRVAAAGGHTEIMKILLSTGAINLQRSEDLDLYPFFAFMRAVNGGHVDAVRYLLELGADINQGCVTNSLSPLRLATEKGHVDLVRFLLGTGKLDVSKDLDLQRASAFYRAVKNDYPEIARMLVECGADPSQKDDRGYTPLHHAATNGSRDLVEYLLSLEGIDPDAVTNEQGTPFTHAAVVEKLPIMQALYATGNVNPDFRAAFTRSSPLCIVSERDNVEIAKWLLSLNDSASAATSQIQDKEQEQEQEQALRVRERKALVDINGKDSNGQTPLYRACISGRTEVVSYLLSHPDILPSEPDSRGQRPFMAAIRKGFEKTAATFLTHPDIDITSDLDHEFKSETPLLVAASKNKEYIVKALVERGVRIDVKDEHFRTPFDWARWWHNEEMERVLEEYARKCRFRRRPGVKDRVALIEGGIERRMARLAEEVRERNTLGF
ncbi:ankyrin repeat-containing domain protein [Aspergillus karnatakaensis]|uniref:ankyrin repeat-containing domain protein n=1 Tax=Aspergillus karnatakaensis TaxID=1810916 RepID=UPI003CCD7432